MSPSKMRILLVVPWAMAAVCLLLALAQARTVSRLRRHAGPPREALSAAATTDAGALPPAVDPAAGSPVAVDASRLKTRVTELENQLRDLLRENSRLAAAAGAAGVEPDRERERGRGGPGRAGFGDGAPPRMTPEQQAEIRQRMQETSTRMQENLQRQHEFFTSLDAAGMSDEQRQNHEKLVSTLAETDQLMAQLQNNPDPETAGQLRRQLFENIGATRDLLNSERQYALVEFARKLNYPDAEAQQFAQYVEYVIDMTSMQRMFTGGMGGRDGRRDERGAAPPAAP
jgi:hypothetical protein